MILQKLVALSNIQEASDPSDDGDLMFCIWSGARCLLHGIQRFSATAKEGWEVRMEFVSESVIRIKIQVDPEVFNLDYFKSEGWKESINL